MSIQDKKPESKTLEDKVVVVPTREYVKGAIEEHAQSRNHPNATLQDKGFVVLSNDVGSDSETMAATPKAVKAAYDLANTANQNATNAHMDDSSLPVGVPVPWPTENPPEGWLICNGDSFDKAKYPKLAIAYPSGRLPDLRAEFIRGADAGRGIDPTINVLSAKPSQIQSHTHDYRDRYYSENNGSIGGATNWEWQPDGYNNSLGSGRTDNDNNTFLYYNGTTSSTGGTETHPRYIAFLYIVKAA
ncbi:phage tail protein [Xenorhabdus japonica]|uniref:Phage Tail Collar Domain n=1 Tax=Xenorhabdus japonica TaxID=53341 RepID=A0A1I5DZI1_9GAMM|nr:phage tail protein [Xenorhabdus japonica]SFO04480.1 Phage Tail Collar Domain [Xenorhabdus japonica]